MNLGHSVKRETSPPLSFCKSSGVAILGLFFNWRRIGNPDAS